MTAREETRKPLAEKRSQSGCRGSNDGKVGLDSRGAETKGVRRVGGWCHWNEEGLVNEPNPDGTHDGNTVVRG
jgi:hypothetical protein